MASRWMSPVAWAAIAASLIGCSSADDTPPTGGAGGAATTSTTAAGGTAQGGGGAGASGGAGGADGGAGAGGEAQAGGGGTGGQAQGGATVNGCDVATATDRTSESTIDLTWSLPHQECIRIALGTEVRWSGDFATHPLAGGISPDVDLASPISIAAPAAGVTSVTFDEAGAFPYFCESHPAAMLGAVFAE